MTARKAVASETRDLLIRQHGKELIVTVPSNAKVTFSEVNPGGRGYSNGSYCLRVYTTANNQLAVFTGVIDFRDLSLGIKERVVTVESKRKKVSSAEGIEDEQQYAEAYEWKEVNV